MEGIPGKHGKERGGLRLLQTSMSDLISLDKSNMAEYTKNLTTRMCRLLDECTLTILNPKLKKNREKKTQVLSFRSVVSFNLQKLLN